MRVHWTARRSNRSILKEINPEYTLEGLMLKLKVQYFDHLKQRADSLEKTLMLEKIESKWRRGRQRMRRLDGITESMDMSLMMASQNEFGSVPSSTVSFLSTVFLEVLEKTLKSPLDNKEIKPVNPKGNQP